MKILAVVLSLTIMVTLLAAAVLLYRDTLCRQKTWQLAFELKTRSLLSQTRENEFSALPSCKILIKRQQEKISWQKLPSLKKNSFILEVKGKL